MSDWIDLKAVGLIVVVGLLAGAGLPALFSIGIRALATPKRGGEPGDAAVGGNPIGMVVGGLCFLIVVAAVAYALYIIIAGS